MRKTHHKIRTARIIITGILTISLLAGMTPFMEPAYGASTFTSESLLNGKTYNHNDEYSGDQIVNGVDVSYFNSAVSSTSSAATNWRKVKKSGVDYAIARVTFTYYSRRKLSTDTDSKFKTHYNKAKAAGVMVGAYVYSQARSEDEAATEALYAIKRLKALGIEPDDLDLPVYMDYEFGGGTSGRLYGLTRIAATNSAKAFCEVIRNAGYKPGIYASTNFYKYYIDTSVLGSDVDIWCAQYNDTNTYTPQYSKWQYSSTANIEGLYSIYDNTKLCSTDVNFWYVDKTVNGSPVTTIYGSKYANYTGKAVTPAYEVYYNGKLLTEGEDYKVSGINNVAAGNAYAYIQGIGSYGGYALVPFKIGSGYGEHIGLDNDEVTDKKGNLIFGNRHLTEEVTKYLVSFYAADGTELEYDYYEEGSSVEAPEVEDSEDQEFEGWVDLDDPESEVLEEIPEVTEAASYAAAYAEEEAEAAETAEEADETVDGEAAEATEETADAAEESAEEDTEETAEETTEETTEDSTEESIGEPEEETSEETAESAGTEERETEITETVTLEDTVYDFDIGYNAYGGYIRNVPEGLTVAEFLAGLELEEGYEDEYTLKVLTSKFKERSDTAEVLTANTLGVYKGDTLVGTAYITVNGSTLNDLGANYLKKAGAAKVKVYKTSIQSLKKYRKAFKVKVAKKSKAYVTGYQVRYSTSKDMSNAKKKTIGTSYLAVSKKIKGLKAKTTYYVQVRSYKTVNGKNYYSAWSAKKSVKTK